LPRAVTEDVVGVPVRRIDPLSPVRGTYLHLHGGGWCLGSHEGQDERLARLADDTGMRVISVGYRLAPEYPYPAAVDDAVAVTQAVVATGQGPFVIGGESAGAHLAASTLLRLRDDGSTPFAGAVLTYGAYDAAGTPSRGDHLGDTLGRWLPHVPMTERRDPKLSPLYANLDGMPAARLLVGTRDFLIDDSLMLAARWQQVAPVELDVVAGAPHGLTLLDIAVTRAARAAEHAFIVRCAAEARAVS
jgi:acetyl esterase/lipase